MRVDRILAGGASLFALASFVACDASAPTGTGPANPALEARVVAPELPDPSQFVRVIDNPFFPLIPGTTFRYRARTEEGVETNTVQVTRDTKSILGIAATVVRDRVFVNGELTEDTFDWYAQDVRGNVWYLGEHSCEIDDGQCVSTEGSWEAGKSGATAGIIMWADPRAHRGKPYRQEFLAGVAEDMAKVVRLNARVVVPYGAFSHCLLTMEWTPLEPGPRERKYYCRGVGQVLTVEKADGRVRSELISISRS
jgi:hypothetical protein